MTSEKIPARHAPLADRMRPRNLDEVVGQTHLVGPGAPLRILLEAGELPSLILWGPPGSGKTTLARLFGRVAGARFVALSAVTSGVRELREVVSEARPAAARGQRTLLFLDEIHRYHRGQQDALLPHVENGTLSLIGATTENPSFEINAPLLSRCRTFTLRALTDVELSALLERALRDREHGLGAAELATEAEILGTISSAADGDARRALGILESAAALAHRRGQHALSLEIVREVAGRKLLLYDRDREEHSNVISALIKSLRASDPDAALYYLARMLEAGEDPLFIARRLIIFAAEDIGNSEPVALSLATSAFLAVERIGMPEGRIPLAQTVTFLACATKSKASYNGLSAAEASVREYGALPVPLHLRNAPTALLRELSYGRGYIDPHSLPDAFVATYNLPPEIKNSLFYQPSGRGTEAEFVRRLAEWRARRSTSGSKPDTGAAQEPPSTGSSASFLSRNCPVPGQE